MIWMAMLLVDVESNWDVMNDECGNMLNAIEMKMIIECMITCNVKW